MRHKASWASLPAEGRVPKRAPGRPRSEEARLAILRSTLEFLEKHGFSALTIESIAAHANVGKATVYRWWPNKAALVADAFAHGATRQLRFPDTGALVTDMSQQMRQLAKVFRSRRGRIVSAILGAGQSDPALISAFRERFLKPRRDEARATLQRGIRRGELPSGQNLDLLLDALYGPIYMRFLIRHDSLTDTFVNELCRLVLGAARRKLVTRAPSRREAR